MFEKVGKLGFWYPTLENTYKRAELQPSRAQLFPFSVSHANVGDDSHFWFHGAL